jgi:hypothetical protein
MLGRPEVEGEGAVVRIAKAHRTIHTNPANGAKAPVARHAEIDNRLARKICQQLEITPIR